MKVSSSLLVSFIVLWECPYMRLTLSGCQMTTTTRTTATNGFLRNPYQIFVGQGVLLLSYMIIYPRFEPRVSRNQEPVSNQQTIGRVALSLDQAKWSVASNDKLPQISHSTQGFPSLICSFAFILPVMIFKWSPLLKHMVASSRLYHHHHMDIRVGR